MKNYEERIEALVGITQVSNINGRVTEAERAEALQRAIAADITISEYLRACIFYGATGQNAAMTKDWLQAMEVGSYEDNLAFFEVAVRQVANGRADAATRARMREVRHEQLLPA